MMGTLEAIARVLATRLILLLAILGGFALAVMAVRDGSIQAAGVVVAFAVLIVIPLIGMEIKSRR